MKTLILLLPLLLCACDPNASNSAGGGSSATQTPDIATPANPASPAAPVTCANLNGTHWVLDGSPTLTPESLDQLHQAPYIAEIDLSNSNTTFTENQYVAGYGTLTCTRDLNDASAYLGNNEDLIWTSNLTSGCQSVAQRIQVDTSVCNVLTISIIDGSGSLYETASYIPQ